MYGGCITEIGTVIATGPTLVIEAPKTAAGLPVGGSVNVSGSCVSAVRVDRDAGRFAFGISAETANRSALGTLSPGARVNLELPLRVGDALDGHLVQGHTDAIGKVTRVDTEHGGSLRVWIRPPKRFLDGIVAKGSVAVEGVSLTVAEVLADRFSVVLIPITLAETTLAGLRPDQRVSLESDLFVKTAGDVAQTARLVASRSLAALPWAGELTGPAGAGKCARHLAAGGGVLIYDPDREAEADVVFAGSRLRPESMAFLLTQVCGHTTVPCDRERLDRLEIGPMPGAGDRHGTAYHVPVDLAAGTGTGVSAHDRAATIRRLAHPGATPADFLRPGHVFPLAGRPGGLAERAGHTEASLALCAAAGLPTVAAICEVMGPDGHMLTGPAVERFALAWSLPLISIGELAAQL
ncbi:MAG TPA: 3,4-dihydroxy-2-butanone-4-phosphate synthase [Streptosporangiaceae bacterium]|jgi:3,4-dihydroxy 2-butanone 4-phosphate synthase/3,4-dihydroxy 2-butanone 4-phosphate synthase/GTP cyclohydrolase II